MKGIITKNSAGKILTPVLAALLLVVGFSTSNAQIRPFGDGFRGGVNVPATVAAGQTVRIRIAVPDNGGSRATGGGHVKVFDGRSALLYETSVESLPGGAVHEFEIDPLALPIAPDPLTGRMILRLKVDLFLKNAVIDSGSVDFPTMFELVDRETQEGVLIALLLPAVQK